MSRLFMFIVAGVFTFCVGCGSTAGPRADSAAPAASVAPYFLTDEPSGAQSVVEAKASAKDGEEVTLVGRIGGSQSPFVAGRAAFTVVDASLVPCSERANDSCKTPWDYCCDTDRLPGGTAVVKVVEADGNTLAKDARKELGLKELQTVIVKGTAKRDEAGNLTVLAPAVFVKR